jgi:ATP phosphoribosyltransferase regulatory subunit
MKTLTPFGVKDLIPEDAKKQEKILKIITKVFEDFGYQKIITPSIEYYDSLVNGMGESLEQQTIKFFDSEGHTLILRPDYTTPIARAVATRMQDAPKPIKLYYTDSVFRKQKSKEADTETFQAGLELIGAQGPESEAEILAILCEILLKLGFSDFGIDIGHIDFQANLSQAQKQALLAGDYLSFGEIPKRGKTEILPPNSPLLAIYNQLKAKGYADHIYFNQGLVKDISYYSGIIFEAYVQEIGSIIASGGRYDNLIEKFGFDCPAVGFSININLILSVL